AALLVGGYAISAALRMSTEEHAGRLSPLLATAVGRRRWLAGHLVFVLGGPVLLLLVGGLAAGLLHGINSSGSFGPAFADGLASMTAPIPAVMVMGGLAVLLFGVLPR